MAGPTDRLTNLAKTLAIARAIVAFDRDDFEDSLELEVSKLEYLREHGPSSLLDKWGCVIRRGTTPWYFRVSRDGSGISQAETPTEAIAATFSVEGKRLAERALRANVADLKAGNLDPGQPITDLDWLRLENSLAAYDDNYRAVVLVALAEAGPSGDAVLVALDRLRERFAADGYLAGEVLATIMLRTTLDPERDAGTPIKYRLGDIADVVLDDGGENALDAVADALRAQFSEQLRMAQAAPDLTTFLDTLYRAVPYGYAAVTLFDKLAAKGEAAQGRDRASRIHRTVQEENARVRHAFVHQISDLGGLQWHFERTSIRTTRAARGDESGRAEAQRLVLLGLYPQSLVSELLAD